jgi:protein-S-isoprenylcysteine O-methyltransferase Ste14
MNFPRIALAAVAAWLVSLAAGFLISDFLAADILLANQAALRPEAEQTANLPVAFMLLLVGFFAFAYAFAKGYEGTSSVMEGVRFGVLVGFMVLGFANIWQWVMYPISGSMAAALVVSSIAEGALYGAVVGAIYRPVEHRSASAAAV